MDLVGHKACTSISRFNDTLFRCESSDFLEVFGTVLSSAFGVWSAGRCSEMMGNVLWCRHGPKASSQRSEGVLEHHQKSQRRPIQVRQSLLVIVAVDLVVLSVCVVKSALSAMRQTAFRPSTSATHQHISDSARRKCTSISAFDVTLFRCEQKMLLSSWTRLWSMQCLVD